LGFILIWVVTLAALGIYELLVALDVIHVSAESAIREVVSY